MYFLLKNGDLITQNPCDNDFCAGIFFVYIAPTSVMGSYDAVVVICDNAGMNEQICHSFKQIVEVSLSASRQIE